MNYLKLLLASILFTSTAIATPLPARFPGFVSSSASSIGSTATPVASAMLDIASTTKGALIPRMTTTQKNAISSPATGLLVYDSTLSALFQYNGAAWKQIASDGLTFTGSVTGHSSLDLAAASNLSDVGVPATAFNNISGFTAVGDTHYGGTSGARSVLAGNTTTTKKFLSQTGSGAASAAPAWAQPACADLSNSVASCSTDTTNAANISSGTLPAARLPNPSSSTLGGTQSAAAVSHQWISSISTSGVPALSQPGFADISGNLSLAQLPTAVTWPSTGTSLSGTPSNHGMLISSGTGVVTVLAPDASTTKVWTSGGSSADPSWQVPSASAAVWAQSSQTSTYTVTSSDNNIDTTGAFDLTLLSAVGINGHEFNLCKRDSSFANVVNLKTTSSQTIGGYPGGGYAVGGLSLSSFNDCYRIVSNNVNYQILGHSFDQGCYTTTIPVVGSTQAVAFTVASTTISVGSQYVDGSGNEYATQSTIAPGTTLTMGTNATPATTGTLTLVRGAYNFAMSATTVVAGDTYTNSGCTYTVSFGGSVTSVQTYGNCNPASSGTLTRASGTGPTTLSYSSYTGTNAASVAWTSRTVSGFPTNGLMSVNKLKYCRLGKLMHMDYAYAQAAGSNGSGDYLFPIVSGLKVDPSIIPFTGIGAGTVGVIVPTTKAQDSYVSGSFMMTTSGTYCPGMETASFYNSTTWRWGCLENAGAAINTIGSGYYGYSNALAWNGQMDVPILTFTP